VRRERLNVCNVSTWHHQRLHLPTAAAEQDLRAMPASARLLCSDAEVLASWRGCVLASAAALARVLAAQGMGCSAALWGTPDIARGLASNYASCTVLELTTCCKAVLRRMRSSALAA
jgi:hypothetical protein